MDKITTLKDRVKYEFDIKIYKSDEYLISNLMKSYNEMLVIELFQNDN